MKHPHTGEILLLVQQEYVTIHKTKVTMIMFTEDAGECIWVTVSDYKLILAAYRKASK